MPLLVSQIGLKTAAAGIICYYHVATVLIFDHSCSKCMRSRPFKSVFKAKIIVQNYNTTIFPLLVVTTVMPTTVPGTQPADDCDESQQDCGVETQAPEEYDTITGQNES